MTGAAVVESDENLSTSTSLPDGMISLSEESLASSSSDEAFLERFAIEVFA